MHDGSILQVRILADADARAVAAQDHAEPDAGVRTDLDIADQGGVGGDEGGARDLRDEAPVWNDQSGHGVGQLEVTAV